MNSLEQELDLLASEILTEKTNSLKLEETLFTSQYKNKEEKLNSTFNFMKFSQMTYSFMRFYRIADVSKLSDQTKELALSIIEEVAETKKLLTSVELPKELKEFLTK